MSKELEILLDEIQFKTQLTLDQIAAKAGYSRPYLNKAKKQSGNKKLIGVLREIFSEILQKDTKGGSGMAIATDVKAMAKEIVHLKALTKVLLHHVAKLSAKAYPGRTPEEWRDELLDDTSLAMKDPG